MYMNSTTTVQNSATRKLIKFLKLLGLAFALSMLNLPIHAVSLHPTVKAKLQKEGKLADYQRVITLAEANGLNTPEKDPIRTPSMLQMLNGTMQKGLFKSSAANDVDTVRVLVILVDFSDNPYDQQFAPYVSRVSASPAMFNDLLFSTDGSNPTGSMTEYYLENSYGTFLVQGVVTDWYRMPKTYATYVGSNQGLQTFSPNAQDLAWDAVSAASVDHDFSQFDSYGPNGVADGKMDGLFVVHAGTGFEDSNNGGINDIHSHKWQLRTARTINGVSVSAYSMEPEESYINGTISPIGVFCHEYGHFLGLPDLYDFDETGSSNSEGLGRWSVMAAGNWLGSSRTPSHYDAWSKIFLGFVTPDTLTTNLRNVSFPQVETSPTIYHIPGQNMPNGEYFLVENRQKVGFDVNIPGSGLLIYHIDEAANPPGRLWGNTNQNRYLVALEQADGRDDLAYGANNQGDGGDPYTALSAEFTDLTATDSKTNTGDTSIVGLTTEVAVWNISASGPTMTANLDLSYSRPLLELVGSAFDDLGNGDGILDQGEQFELSFTVNNLWATGAATYVKVRTTSPDLTLTTDSVFIGQLDGRGATTSNAGSPFAFTVAPDVTPRIDTVFFEFHSDNELNVITLPLKIEVGAPEILIVNADAAGENLEFYAGDMDSRRSPYRTHVTAIDGPISSAQMTSYKNVIWTYGDHSLNAPTADQKQAIMGYLNNGGNLLISGQNLVERLAASDSVFLATYLHAVDFGVLYSARQAGVIGSPIGDGLNETRIFGNGGASNWNQATARAMTPVNGAVPALQGFGAPVDAYHALTFSGSYKLAFFSFPLEAIEQNEAAASRRTQRRVIIERTFEFFGNLQTDVVDDGSEPLLPSSFTLAQNYPNPFNPSTTIKYTITAGDVSSRPMETELSIYNVLGQQVRVLVSRQETPGEYSVEWDGATDSGDIVASGIYFYRLKRGAQSQTRKMVLLK
jgi:M6 family metalloprotease-like protein